MGNDSDGHDVDPATVEVVRNYLQSAAEEMRESLVRTAYNTIIYEILDFGITLYDADRRLVAEAPGLEIISLGNDYALDRTVEHLGEDAFGPGDVVLMNYPYWSGRHPNDAVLIAPVYHEDSLVNYLLVRAHWLDVGAKESGYVLDSTDVFQEGTVFPGTKLYDGGEPNEEVFDLIRFNSRMSEKVLGDVNAQLAAIGTGRSRLGDLYENYGPDVIRSCVDRVIEHGERKARSALAELPDGSWSAADHLDTDGVGGGLVRMEATVTIDGDSFAVDFEGSDDEHGGPMNVPYAMTEGVCKFWLKRLTTPGEAPNAGHYEPLDVSVPDGSVVDASYPAPTYTVFGAFRAVEVVLKALAQGLSDRVPAGSGGDLCGIMLVGEDPDTGELFTEVSNQGVGWGATVDRDGEHALMHVSEAGARNVPVEVWENLAPVQFDRAEIRPDSGGPGEYRGGVGVRRDYRFTDDVDALYLGTKTLTDGWGLDGGRTGARNELVVYPRDDWRERVTVHVGGERPSGDGGWRAGMLRGSFRSGEVLSNRTGGGSGFGDPLDRDPDAVRRDVREGYVTLDGARDDYGVVLTEAGDVDRESTAALRSSRRAEED